MCNKTLIVESSKYYRKLLCNSYNSYVQFSGKPIGLSNLKQWASFPKGEVGLSTTTRNTFSRDCLVNNSQHLTRSIGIPSTIRLGLTGFRHFCTKKQDDMPKIMDFPQVVWPSMFKTIRNWILSNFIIMRYFDNDFNLADFIAGSKKAVEIVSGHISRGDIDNLAGLMTPEVIAQIRESLNVFTLKQRQEFAINVEDIYFCFPYEVGVMFPNEDKREENQNRFVEITMCYHAIKGLKELRDQAGNPSANLGVMPEYQDKIFICNYRFIREFTKGVNDDWTINAVNHFKPSAVV